MNSHRQSSSISYQVLNSQIRLTRQAPSGHSGVEEHPRGNTKQPKAVNVYVPGISKLKQVLRQPKNIKVTSEVSVRMLDVSTWCLVHTLSGTR